MFAPYVQLFIIYLLECVLLVLMPQYESKLPGVLIDVVAVVIVSVVATKDGSGTDTGGLTCTKLSNGLEYVSTTAALRRALNSLGGAPNGGAATYDGAIEAVVTTLDGMCPNEGAAVLKEDGTGAEDEIDTG